MKSFNFVKYLNKWYAKKSGLERSKVDNSIDNCMRIKKLNRELISNLESRLDELSTFIP